MSPGHQAQDGAPRAATRESEERLCMPPTLTPSKEFLEEKVGPDFGAARKRPLIKEEQEDAEEGEREKRAKLSMGENFRNVPTHSHFHLLLLFICFCSIFDTPGFIPVPLKKKKNLPIFCNFPLQSILP